jgi:hypothetical protein
MKRRIRKIVNFFAFNLLFFALYLNFIHKDSAAIQPVLVQTNAAAVFNGTAPVQNPEKYLETKTNTSVTAQQTAVTKTDEGSALKLSIN